MWAHDWLIDDAGGEWDFPPPYPPTPVEKNNNQTVSLFGGPGGLGGPGRSFHGCRGSSGSNGKATSATATKKATTTTTRTTKTATRTITIQKLSDWFFHEVQEGSSCYVLLCVCYILLCFALFCYFFAMCLLCFAKFCYVSCLMFPPEPEKHVREHPGNNFHQGCVAICLHGIELWPKSFRAGLTGSLGQAWQVMTKLKLYF